MNNSLVINNIDEFYFGSCPKPVKLKNGLTIGAGSVYPEINFTLPPMEITLATMPEVRSQYEQIIDDICKRARSLQSPGFIVEFELLPDLTLTPEWGAEITKIIKDKLLALESEMGIKTGLRVTPNDIREFAKPPLMQTGEFVEKMFKSIELCTRNGGDLVAIESTGGKEIHDEAILQGDLLMSIFALSILGARDMTYLWRNIVEICNSNDCIPSGDSACGFANTAMVLADTRYIPKVWAAIIRVMATPRSLVAYTQGAVGPSKDCAYEGVFLKAMTGIPVALEGADAACAHLSPIGNITKAVADLWRNESVQNIKLLGAMAPTVSFEQIEYTARLMNIASAEGSQSAITLRDWFAKSDSSLDPQAYVLDPHIALELADIMVKQPTSYLQTRAAAQHTIDIIKKGHELQILSLEKVEIRWLDRFAKIAESLPEDEEEFIKTMLPIIPKDKINLTQYGIIKG